MSEFLALSDDEKVIEMEKAGDIEQIKTMIKDESICSQCGGSATAADYCFGCHKLICVECTEKEPHLTNCWMRIKQEPRGEACKRV